MRTLGFEVTTEMPMPTNYREQMAALGFSPVEIAAIEFVLLRMGALPLCPDHRPRFVECYPLDDDGRINEVRWRKLMAGMGFRPDVVKLAEHALGICLPDCELCFTRRGTALS